MDLYNPRSALNHNDPGNCPVLGMLHAIRDYSPKWAYNFAMYRKYGLVTVRQDGECSIVSSTGEYFDFLVPCQSHDYCYDLRRAGFDRTISDSDCDRVFYEMMKADCEVRSHLEIEGCEKRAKRYGWGVKIPLLGTADPRPGLVEIKNVRTNQCLTVPKSSQRDDVQLSQKQCTGTNNQQFRIKSLPDSSAGNAVFTIEPAHSHSRCIKIYRKIQGTMIIVTSWKVVQWVCDTYTDDSMKLKIKSVDNQNIYTIRSSSNAICIKLNSSSTGSLVMGSRCDRSTSDYLYHWRITNVN